MGRQSGQRRPEDEVGGHSTNAPIIKVPNTASSSSKEIPTEISQDHVGSFQGSTSDPARLLLDCSRGPRTLGMPD